MCEGDAFVKSCKLPHELYGATEGTKWWHADYDDTHTHRIISRITANEVVYKRFAAGRALPMEFSHTKLEFQVALDSGKFTLKSPDLDGTEHPQAPTVFEFSVEGKKRYEEYRQEIRQRDKLEEQLTKHYLGLELEACAVSSHSGGSHSGVAAPPLVVAAEAGKPEEAGGSRGKRRAGSPPDVRVSKKVRWHEALVQPQAQAHALQTKLDYAEKQVRDLKTSLGLGYEAHQTKQQENARLQAENARLQAQLAEVRQLCLNAGVPVKSMCKTCGHPVFDGQRRGRAKSDEEYVHADGACDQHMQRSV